MNNKSSTTLYNLTIFIIVSLILAFSLKGIKGNPNPIYIKENLRQESKPFELSPERGRYALIQSIAENRTLFFSKEIAEYVSPDLGYINGRFVSLFAPGVSFIAYPFYLIGRFFNMAQVATFSISIFFALLNFYLIYKITNLLTSNKFLGITCGIIFLFATNAWAYATTLYQHHITTFLLLVSLYLLLESIDFRRALIIGFLSGFSILIEYPNFVFFIPILIFTLIKFINIQQGTRNLYIRLNTSFIAILFGLILSLTPTFFYNSYVNGSPLRLSGTVQDIKNLSVNWDTGEVKGGKPSLTHGNPFSFFNLPNIPISMSVLLISKDRGLIWYAPILIFGIFGIIPLYRKRRDICLLLIVLISIIFFLYGTWGDPWGGWAFGPRYLIPTYSFISILIGAALNRYGNKIWFIPTFIALFVYSLSVNLAGAITTNQLPPSVEVDYLRYPKYLFLYNFDLIKLGKSSSFIYNYYFLNKISLINVSYIIFFLIVIIVLVNYSLSLRENSFKKIRNL